jgi:signal transduction histidine kinase
LANLNRRLDQIGGRTEVQSRPGAGTTVTFYVPVKQA